jgi:hypothetical protein
MLRKLPDFAFSGEKEDRKDTQADEVTQRTLQYKKSFDLF